MRISDWSSDVCSSDLPDHQLPLYISRASRKTRSIRSLPAPMRVDPSQRGPETNMNQWGVKIYRATKKARRDRKSTRLKLQSLMRISYAVFCLKKKKTKRTKTQELTEKQKQNYKH